MGRFADLREVSRRQAARVANGALSNERVLRQLLPAARGARVSRPPDWPTENGVLQHSAEWEAAEREVRALGLRPHPDGPKNWDALSALAAVLRRTSSDEAVLDAGATLYSPLLYWLYRYGYRSLTSVNLEFGSPISRGPIRFLPGDLTETPFPDGELGALTCLSVIEHGVDVRAALAEFARVLRPGGIAVVSFDYFSEPTDTSGLSAYGTAVRVFDRADMLGLLDTAAEVGLQPSGPVSLESRNRTVHWERMDLRFTFALVTLVRV